MITVKSKQRYKWTNLGECFQFTDCNQWKYIDTTDNKISLQDHQINKHFLLSINKKPHFKQH
jgi:hypothetical protein